MSHTYRLMVLSAVTMACLAMRGLAAEPAVAQPDAPNVEEQGPNSGRIHLKAGLDLTSAYYWRGFREEDQGLIAQPRLSLGFDLLEQEDLSLSASFDLWSSYHSKKTSATTPDEFMQKLFETDYTFTLNAEMGKSTLGVGYVWYTSPSGAFTTIEELAISFSYDDSELLGEWSLSPSAILAIETGQGTSDNGRKGVYLQLGVAPGFTLDDVLDEPISISFPVAVGLSLSNYYEDAGGDDDFFGFASLGVSAGMPLPVGKEWGAWELTLGANVFFLGDVAAATNDDDDVAFAGTIGLSIEY